MKVSPIFLGAEEFLQQQYLPSGLEFGQSFAALGLGKAGGPFTAGFWTRRIYGAAGFPIRIPGQEDAAFLCVLEQVALLYRRLAGISGDAL